jgi:hypothetical protein
MDHLACRQGNVYKQHELRTSWLANRRQSYDKKSLHGLANGIPRGAFCLGEVGSSCASGQVRDVDKRSSCRALCIQPTACSSLLLPTARRSAVLVSVALDDTKAVGGLADWSGCWGRRVLLVVVDGCAVFLVCLVLRFLGLVLLDLSSGASRDFRHRTDYLSTAASTMTSPGNSFGRLCSKSSSRSAAMDQPCPSHTPNSLG